MELKNVKGKNQMILSDYELKQIYAILNYFSHTAGQQSFFINEAQLAMEISNKIRALQAYTPGGGGTGSPEVQ